MVQTKKTQSKLTANKALKLLKDGNARFVENRGMMRDYRSQVSGTSGGQFPFAVILSCIDSRVPAEVVFDQGIGDIFSTRVAGNIVNEDVLGSIEYSCKVAGSKVVVVMGHSKCGAVTAACKGVKLGNITPLLSKIQPAVNQVIQKGKSVTDKLVEEVCNDNIQHAIARIRKESKILADMEKNGEIKIVSAKYHVEDGSVTYLD